MRELLECDLTLARDLQSMLEALQHVGAKASINANLKTYRYFDNVGLPLCMPCVGIWPLA